MKTHDREILIYYNPDSRSHRLTVAYAKTVSNHVKAYAFGQTPSTETSWRSIIEALNLHPKELMNKAHPYYQLHIRGREFEDENWATILRRNPQIIKAPIAIRGRKVILCITPTDVYRLF